MSEPCHTRTLVLDERDERAEHHGDARRQQCRKLHAAAVTQHQCVRKTPFANLVAQTLSSARRHEHKAVALRSL